MAILVKLDDLLHDRRMTLTELAERVDITLANLSIRARLPAGRPPGISTRRRRRASVRFSR
jgi:DNA-binding Xre family transcriptional regulator